MSINYSCISCEKEFVFPDKLSWTEQKCPKCWNIFIIPWINKELEDRKLFINEMLKQVGYFKDKYLLSDESILNLKRIREELWEIVKNSDYSDEIKKKKWRSKLSEINKYTKIETKNKEKKLKYYKIFFLWNKWFAINLVKYKQRWNHGMEFKLNTLETWIDMYEAEKILMKNDWDMNNTIKEIQSTKWTLKNYNFKNSYLLGFMVYFDRRQNIIDRLIILILFIMFFIIVWTMDIWWAYLWLL